MEAEARYDFKAESQNELQLTRGAIVKILDTSDESWYKAEHQGHKGYVPSNFIALRPNEWFYGRIARLDAENQLQRRGEPGDFLVRDSESDPGTFSISVRHADGVMHFKVLCDRPGEYRVWEQSYPSINALVKSYQNASISHKVPGLCLRRPLPRSTPICSRPLRLLVAKFDFEPQEESELEFRRDDIVELLEEVEEDWWRGKCNGKIGLFPRIYCQELPHEPA